MNRMTDIHLAFVGDVMCGDQFSHLGWGMASQIGRYGAAIVPDEIANRLRSHDVVFGNIECVLAERNRRDYSLRSLHMRGRPAAAKYIAQWGFTVVNVANNHILEQGLDAARETVEHLQNAGLQVIGAGKNRRFEPGIEPLRQTIKDHSLSWIGVCFHPGRYAYSGGWIRKEDVLERIRQEAQDHQFVIVSVHWGLEYIDYPGLEQRQFAQKMVDAGARLVIGHHPHVFQGIVTLQSSLVAFSLGNFIFDMDWTLTAWSAILSLTVSDGRILKWDAPPFLPDTGYRPHMAKGSQEESLRREIRRRCELANQPIEDESIFEHQYQQGAHQLELESRSRLKSHLLRNWFRYKPIYWPQILVRPIQRRLKVW
jgi:gamma-polyglutamate biosynthesis protein CapA